MQIKEKVKPIFNKYEEHKKWIPALFFVGGFIFDLFTLGRIDSLANLAVQFVYLSLIFTLLSLEIFMGLSQIPLSHKWLKIYKYKDEVVHFLFGSLFSAYVIFYFKSASFWASFFILCLLFVILVANETQKFRQSSILVKFILFYFCLLSYFLYLIPILIGNIGIISFSLTLGTVCAFLFAHKWSYNKWIIGYDFFTQILRPNLIFLGVFLFLHLTHFIPPVPLHIQKMGIYHKIEQKNNKYELSYQRAWWRLWQKGAQTFVPNETGHVYCFASVFSPTSFEDQVVFHWRFKQEGKDWMTTDRIKINIQGGREEGFRAYSKKSKVATGHWEVLVETLRGREIGRISFYVDMTEENSHSFESEWI